MMIVCIRNLLGGADISDNVERDSQFSIEATFGARMDVLTAVIHDPDRTLALPNRREIVIYDAPSATDILNGATGTSDVIDPPWAVSPYNTFLHGTGHENTSTDPTQWTPRLFAGYLATPAYQMISTERAIGIQAQDYTYRLRSTVINQAFDAGLDDDVIVKTAFATVRPDFNRDNIMHTFAGMPAISFPVHSLEQFMQRVTKVTRAVYRVDYYKRVWYGPIGQFPAPFSLSETPDDLSSFGYEEHNYTPDSSSLADRVWVVGRDFQSATQTYDIPDPLVDSTHFQFVLPGSATKHDIVSVQVGAGPVWTPAGGGVGESPQDGDITDQSTFKTDVVMQPTPPTIAFKVTPTTGQRVRVIGKFRYPLIQIYSDAGLVASVGGLYFDAVVRDKRIRDLVLAQKVGKAYLQNQGNTLKGFTATIMKRQLNGVVIGPAQTLDVHAPLLFTGLPDLDSAGHPIAGSEVDKTFIITRTTITLDDQNDLEHPYRVEIEAADHAFTGGQ